MTNDRSINRFPTESLPNHGVRNPNVEVFIPLMGFGTAALGFFTPMPRFKTAKLGLFTLLVWFWIAILRFWSLKLRLLTLLVRFWIEVVRFFARSFFSIKSDCRGLIHQTRNNHKINRGIDRESGLINQTPTIEKIDKDYHCCNNFPVSHWLTALHLRLTVENFLHLMKINFLRVCMKKYY